jgi:alkylation response protein AidB-like acyl-CoA dehydrogenase
MGDTNIGQEGSITSGGLFLMTCAAGYAEAEDSPILHATLALAAQIGASADAIEQARRIPMSLVEALKKAGVFGMAMPRAWGGPELDPLTQFRVIEALAMADGSVGWCAMINCDGGYITAFLDQEVGKAMYPDLQVGTAAAATPTGEARRVSGGYRVSGRFPFASGCQHCEWIWLGCIVTENDEQLVDNNGVPHTRQCLVKLSECEILDTWYTTGLRGTGSNDIMVKDVFVEAKHTFSFQDGNLIKRPGPLYAFPFMFAAKSSPVALGIARLALQVLIETATKKSARRYSTGDHLEPPKLMRDDVFIQEAVGRAEVIFRGHGRFLGVVGGWQRTHARTDCPFHHSPYVCRGRLCGCGATRVQGSRRYGGLSKGTARSLPA